MQGKDETRTVARLMSEYMRGRISRREMVRRGVALGISGSALAMLAGSPRRAFAQDSTPAADEAAGSTLTAPAGLRTDLQGQTVRAVLAEASSPDRPWLEAALALFSETTGATAELIPGETSATDRLAAYNQQFAAQSSDNDVYQIDVIWPGIVGEHAVDLSEPLSDLAGQHFEAIVANNTVDDKLVGMPWFTDAGLLYYRTDLLEKYSLQPPTTWDELTTMAQTIQDGERAANPDFYGFVFQGNVYEGLTCNGLEWQYSYGGGTIVEPDGTVSVNNEQAIASFERAKSWVGTIAPQGVTTYQEPDSLNVFTAGNAAFLRNWPYAYAASQDAAATAGKVGVSPLPKGNGPDARNADTLGGWQMMVSKYSKNQEAAIEFVKFMCSPEVQKSYAIERSHLPTIASVYDEPEVAEASEFIPRLKEVFQGGAVARPSSVTGELYNEVSIAYHTLLNQVLTGEKDAASAAQEMEDQISSIIEE
ncbi:MAG: ABC transporter substrate-binding protein [Chloroflexota bacterium]|nr:ABC transporter substrate-binding protein [Chloroflexota bacterium]